jgi:hypothetical protein
LAGLLAVLVLLSAVPSVAQVSSGTISGIVQDSQAAFVAGAAVTLTNQAQGAVIRQMNTTEAGAFFFTPLSPGTYTVTVEAPGFKKFTKKDIVLSTSDRLGLPPIVLELGAVGESITVTAELVNLQSVSAERSGVIEETVMMKVPNLQRRMREYMELVPGSNGDTINGNRGEQTSYAVDGVMTMDTGGGYFWYRLNTDVIAEVKLVVNSAQAEFGRSSGANVTMTTKQGTRDFHGGAYTYIRNEWMNANTWANNYYGRTKPMSRYSTTGFTVGGPIYIPGKFNTDKNKLFFFGNMEWLRQKNVTAFNSRTVPTALQRAGDFSQTRDGSNKPVIIYDPSNKVPFGGNKIPQALWDPLGVKVLNYFPMPNKEGVDPNFNYQYEYLPSQPKADFTYRFDYNISPKWRAFVRLIRNYSTEVTDGGMGLSSNLSDIAVFASVVNLTTTISPTLTNEFYYGNTQCSVPKIPEEGSKYLIANAGLALPLLHKSANPDGVIASMQFGSVPNAPNIAISGFPKQSENPVINWNDNISKVFSKHMIKAGIFFETTVNRQTGNAANNGSYSFDRDSANPLDTNWAFSNALMGNFRSFAQTDKFLLGYYRYRNYEWYIQDTWRVLPNLTLDYGIRFGLLPHRYDEKDQLAGFNPDLYDPSQKVSLYQKAIDPATGKLAALNPVTGQYVASLYIGAIVPGVGNLNNGTVKEGLNGYPRGLINKPGLKYMPRFGVAWTPGGADGKTVIRAGGGVFYDRITGSAIFGFLTNPPTVRQASSYYGNFASIASLQQTSFPGAISGAFRDIKIPVNYNYNVGVQRALPFGTLLDVSFVGLQARHVLETNALNSPGWGSAWLPQNQDPTVTPKYDGTTTLPVDFTRPYAGYGKVNLLATGASTNYNSLQVSATRRMAKGIQYNVAYTWSKVLGTAHSYGTVGNPEDRRKANYGRLENDRGHVVSISYVWELPDIAQRRGVLDNALARGVLNGWEFSGRGSMMSGRVTTPSWSYTNASGSALNRKITGDEDWAPRVVLTGNPNLPQSERTAEAWINTSVFQPAAKGSHGMDSAINPITLPGKHNWDMAFFKRIPLGADGQRYLQLRLEAYNAFNHPSSDRALSTAPQFDQTGKITNLPTSLGGGGGRFGFGALTMNSPTGTSRVLQVAVKFFF